MQVAVAGKTVWIPGYVLEAAFECQGGGHLLFSTDDVPYEEALHVVLFDITGGIIDERQSSAAYSTGTLRDIVVVSARAVEFSFFGGDRWIAEVASGMLKPRPRWVPRRLWRGLHVERLA